METNEYGYNRGEVVLAEPTEILKVADKADLLEATRAFDGFKHKPLETSAAFRNANVDGKLEMIVDAVQNLRAAYRKLVELRTAQKAGDVDGAIMHALEKRVLNYRDANGDWRGAQFGIELTEYAKLVDRIAPDEVDPDSLEQIASGFEELRAVCERFETRFTFEKKLSEILAALAE